MISVLEAMLGVRPRVEDSTITDLFRIAQNRSRDCLLSRYLDAREIAMLAGVEYAFLTGESLDEDSIVMWE